MRGRGTRIDGLSFWVGRIENILISLIFVWLGEEKWKDRKLFCLVEKKNRRIENRVYIYLHLYPYYIFFLANIIFF